MWPPTVVSETPEVGFWRKKMPPRDLGSLGSIEALEPPRLKGSRSYSAESPGGAVTF